MRTSCKSWSSLLFVNKSVRTERNLWTFEPFNPSLMTSFLHREKTLLMIKIFNLLKYWFKRIAKQGVLLGNFSCWRINWKYRQLLPHQFQNFDFYVISLVSISLMELMESSSSKIKDISVVMLLVPFPTIHYEFMM